MKSGNVAMAVFGAIFRVVVAVLAVFLIYRGAVLCYDYGYRIFTEPAISSGEGRTVTVTVTEDMSASDIGKLFESKGLVKEAGLFTLQYYLSEFRADVKPGTFELSTSMTAEEMMEAMTVAPETDGEDGAGETLDGENVGGDGETEPSEGEE